MRVHIDNLSFGYQSKLVINNLSFSLKSGNFLTILGNNGTGKTTLIKCILKKVKVADDSIFLDDVDINKMKKFYNVGYVPQKVDFNYEFPITVSEVLSASCNGKTKTQLYNEIINRLELNSYFNENINSLSGGQLQRVFIARSLLNNPKLLILDEPTVGVDSSSIQNLISILTELKKKEVTIILVTHDESPFIGLSDYFLYLNEVGSYEFKKAEVQDDSK